MKTYIGLLVVSLLLTTCAFGQRDSACWDKANTQSAMTECGGKDLAKADAGLNATYQALLKKAGSDPVAVNKIRKAQRAWLAFRDAQLEAYYPHSDKPEEYGSVYPMCRASLQEQLTTNRTNELRHMLERKEGDVCGYYFHSGTD